MEERAHFLLTRRERETLALVAQGLDNQEIAEHLCIAVSTVKSGLHRICVKLKAPNRAQAVLIALRQKHLSPDDIYALEELADFIERGGPKAMEKMVEILKHKLESNQPLRHSRSISPFSKPKLVSFNLQSPLR